MNVTCENNGLVERLLECEEKLGSLEDDLKTWIAAHPCDKSWRHRFHTIFNAEKYIHPCIESLMAQTHSDFEMISVEDFPYEDFPLSREEPVQ